MRAAEGGNIDICILLLKAEANPFLKDNNDRTAEMYAKLCHPDKNIHEMLKMYCQDV